MLSKEEIREKLNVIDPDEYEREAQDRNVNFGFDHKNQNRRTGRTTRMLIYMLYESQKHERLYVDSAAYGLSNKIVATFKTLYRTVFNEEYSNIEALPKNNYILGTNY